MVFDVIILAILVVFTVVGYFKGFLNQFISLIAIVLAYWLSPRWAPALSGLTRDLLPFSFVIADLFARLAVGIVIFICVKIIGKLVEFVMGSKLKEMAGINRWGGFFFGFLKSIIIIFIVMIFVTLLPGKVVKKRFEFLNGSLSYKIAKKYNPVINPEVMENLRGLANTVKSKTRLETITKSAVYQDYLKTKKIDDPLGKKENLRDIQKGDVDSMKKKGIFELLYDKDFMDFVRGEKYYKDDKPEETK